MFVHCKTRRSVTELTVALSNVARDIFVGKKRQAESAVAKRFGRTSWESESGRKMKTWEVTIDDPQTCNGEPKI